MKNWILAVSLLFAGGVCTLLAADFWNTKKFTEWNEKEVMKVLSDSPWATKVSIPRPPGGPGGGGPGGGGRGGGGRGGGMAFLPQDEGGGGAPGGGGGGGGRGGGGRGGGMAFLPQDEGGGGGAPGGGGGGGGRGGGGGGGGMGGGASFSQEIELTMRWITALPIKQANVLRQFGIGKDAGSNPDAAKRLAREEQYYIAQIEGYPGNLTPEAVTAAAQLVVKGVPPISPAQVEVSPASPTGRGPAPRNIFLVFPKAQPNARLLKVEDGEVEVVINMPGLKLKRKFKLKEMVFNGKLEI